MSLLGSQVFANPDTPIWLPLSGGGGGSTGPTGAAGPTGATGATGAAGGSGDVVVLQATTGFACPGASVVTPIDFTPLLVQGTSIQVVSSNVVKFNDAGVYKVTINSGFANGNYGGNPYSGAWAIFKDEFGSNALEGTATTGSGFNGSSTQVFVQPPVADWTAEFVMVSDIGITYNSPFMADLNAEVTRIA